MYNTGFKVKYNDIETELIHNLKNTKKYFNKNIDNNDDTDQYEYSEQDVLDICSKLYRDEILSVFNIDEFSDEKINSGMKYVYKIMMMNEKFKKLINDLEEIYFREFIENKQNITKKQENIREIILMTLFSQHVFYITHKCICQQIELGIIDEDLLVELRQNLVKY
jgi:hypothetical protein